MKTTTRTVHVIDLSALSFGDQLHLAMGLTTRSALCELPEINVRVTPAVARCCGW